jgi:nitrogen fixation protein
MGWLAVCASLGISSWACAGDFWNRFKKDTQRNNYWPEPFVTTDRLSVREPFAIQANNGWRLQNTIGDGYFEPDTQELNLAGQMKVKWVVTQSPLSRRTVYVMTGGNDEMTMIRVDSVQRAISRYIPKGELPEVLLTDRDINGGSGEYFDAVDRALKSSVPSPRLAPSSGANANGAGGNASGS